MVNRAGKGTYPVCYPIERNGGTYDLFFSVLTSHHQRCYRVYTLSLYSLVHLCNELVPSALRPGLLLKITMVS